MGEEEHRCRKSSKVEKDDSKVEEDDATVASNNGLDAGLLRKIVGARNAPSQPQPQSDVCAMPLQPDETIKEYALGSEVQPALAVKTDPSSKKEKAQPLGRLPATTRNGTEPDSEVPGAYAVAAPPPESSLNEDDNPVNQPQQRQQPPAVLELLQEDDVERGLTEATPVSGEERLQHAEEAEPRRKTSKKLQLIGVLFVVCLCGMTLLLVFLLPKKNKADTQAPTEAPTNAPTEPTLEDSILSLFPTETVNKILEEPQSAQSLAFQWLMNDTLVETYNHQRIYQRFALAALFYATKGPHWLNNQGWLNYTVHECQWYAGETYALQAFGVESLGIYFDDVEPYTPAAHPCDAETNTTYEHLWLNSNLLDGTLPSDIWWGLTNLKSIAVGVNSLQGYLPTQLGLLTDLEALGMVGLDGIGGSLPTELGLLSNLLELDVVADLEGTIPSQIGRCSNLTIFSLERNNLSGPLPTQIGLLTDLIYLEYADNQLTGTMPTELGLLTAVRRIRIARSKLSGNLPSQLGMAQALEDLDFSFNIHLDGTVPSQMGLLSNMNFFSLFGNSLRGTIPSQLGHGFTRMTGFLSVAWNQMSGTIPSELGLLTNMDYGLFVDNNTLTGTIPTEMGQLSSSGLSIQFHDNQLTGTIPTQLGQLTGLRDLGIPAYGLSFYNNMLTGTVPSELGNLHSVPYLSMASNPGLVGTLPSELGNLVSVVWLRFHSTQISGTLATWWGSLTSLAQVYLDNTLLSGPIPYEIELLARNHSLVNFDIAGSQISGILPDDLCPVVFFECGMDLVCGCNCSCTTTGGFVNGTILSNNHSTITNVTSY